MGETTGRLSPGDVWRPAADALNGYQDAADYVRDLKAGGGALPVRGDSRQVVIVTVKNTSGQDCSRFDVLGIDSPIFLPADNLDVFCNRAGFSCIKPQILDHARRFVVLLQPVAKDDLVQACLVGVVPVRLKVVFEWHQFAHIAEDDPTCLVSDCVGYPILWKDSDADENGNRWALVKIGGPGVGMGIWKNTGSAAVGAHGHFRVTGVSQDSARPTAIMGSIPSNQLGPDYAVNGSQMVAAGHFGICQQTDHLYATFKSITSPEPGDSFGPTPGSNTVTPGYPPICRCLGVVDPDNSVMLIEKLRQPQRFKLHEPLYECGSAEAQVMGRSGLVYGTCGDYAPSIVSDTLGAVSQSPLALRDSKTGKLFIPAGQCLNARYAHGPGDFWEVLDLSECSCGLQGSLSSQSGSSSESSHSGSGSFSASASASASSSHSDSQSASASGSDDQNSSSGSQSQSTSGSASVSGSNGSGGSTGDTSASDSQPSGSQPSGSQGSDGSTGSGSGSGFTGSIDLVNAVWCDENKIKYSTLTLSFQNGLLMGVG